MSSELEPKQSVLAIEDDPSLARLIKATLAQEGYDVLTATTLAGARQMIAESPPDVILLDLGLPDGDGVELLRAKDYGASARVLCLTGRSEEDSIVRALDAGADDYLVKPFHPDELCARIRAVLRRAESGVPDGRVVIAGDVTVDLGRRLVKKRGDVVPLTRNEWNLIAELAKSAGRVVLHGDLLTRVWGAGFENDMAYLRVWGVSVASQVGRRSQRPEDRRHGDGGRIQIGDHRRNRC